MNSFKGHIKEIKESGSLSLVTIEVGDGIEFKSIVIETSQTADYLRIENIVNVLFKETEVVIGTNEDHKISLQNRVTGRISNIDQGSLLSKISIDTAVGTIISIISTNAVVKLDISKGSEVMAMVKLNEVMLSAV